ncbi:MAG TPA: pathogenicity-like protein [Pseudoxanthomonas sp.]|nr:pathogenicity-like protein [Pseudoxanthomonas sp.]
MRQVFTSLRIETVEGVARLLEEAGIEVHLANGRSYHSKRGGLFSYAQPMQAKQQPSLWVRHAEDQPRARAILRQAGLLASTRKDQPSSYVFAREPKDDSPRRPLAWKIRIALLIAIAIAALVTVIRHRAMPPVAQAPAAMAPATSAAPDDGLAEDEVRIRIPSTPIRAKPAPTPESAPEPGR